MPAPPPSIFLCATFLWKNHRTQAFRRRFYQLWLNWSFSSVGWPPIQNCISSCNRRAYQRHQLPSISSRSRRPLQFSSAFQGNQETA